MRAKVKKEVLIENYGKLSVGDEIDVIDCWCNFDGNVSLCVLDNGRQVIIDSDAIEITDYRQYVNWENIRYEFAKAAMQGFCSRLDDTFEKIAEYAVRQADALIEELKKEKNDTGF